DRAVLDALASLHGMSLAEAIRANLPGIDPAHFLPEFAAFDVTAFLARLRPAERLHIRHTVGLVDPITAADRRERVGDGLPETLEEVVAAYGHAYFKLKVAGDPVADVARLGAIAAVLDRLAEPYHVTLDGNEQYESVAATLELWDRMQRTPALRRPAAPSSSCRARTSRSRPGSRFNTISRSCLSSASPTSRRTDTTTSTAWPGARPPSSDASSRRIRTSTRRAIRCGCASSAARSRSARSRAPGSRRRQSPTGSPCARWRHRPRRPGG